jgi:hypothetical protein
MPRYATPRHANPAAPEEPKFLSMLEKDLVAQFRAANAKMDEISKGLNQV